MSALYVVSTPIGNLKDITYRAVEILSNVELILAEDTRKTKRLLAKYNIQKPLESFHEHNESEKIDLVISKLRFGTNVALVSDAGTPTISDPGFKLVRAAVQNDIQVFSIPGPSAILTALTASGLPTNQFFFLGYFPKKKSKQEDILVLIEDIISKKPTTIIFYESPYRVKETISVLAEKFPNRDVVIARELTKIHEEYIRGKLNELAKKNFVTRGEFTILLR
ncbi:MAG: 16S rRNA (cytidine(1402)-2'-O)-methyltransferase [Candidatus Woykebacteria bacterium RBG_16_43_9]|uniref:Ribosomal RNA small subunit methyltransferase I n=1 Tax=Candidatus Woykebacteria bacterium RBG_16_43_9 TaxID=1802596 RepID=A0A1G1WHF5_9BACT|nr:MAG: 16S rRNA (cytidine(1402)-2'-O)-methyltransferase [Candidatus Woykebacteria bacterium RBG_16_43_9]